MYTYNCEKLKCSMKSLAEWEASGNAEGDCTEIVYPGELDLVLLSLVQGIV